MASFWQDRRTADAAFAAACAVIGHGPDERHEEASGTAFWWTTSRPAWPHGVVVFRRHGHDWQFIPLDRVQNPIRGHAVRLHWPAELPPDEAARRIAEFLGDPA